MFSFASRVTPVVVAIASAESRHAIKPVVPVWMHDAIALVAGLLGAYLVMRFHAQLFGTGAVL